MKLVGFDHADVRVASLGAVEAFYDALLPALGLSHKTASHVGLDGEWYDVNETRPRNAIEYSTPIVTGERGWFVGFIEDARTVPTGTRLAFALDREAALPEVEQLVRAAGGHRIEFSDDDGYPALFFEDPSGTRLEICARRPRDAGA